MRREKLYLTDIVKAADAIQQFLVGVQRDTFLQDDLLRSAVLHKLTVIGEAAARVSPEFRERHTDQDAPELRRKVADMLAQEYPGTMASNREVE